jgi:hypothetical protein
MAPQTIKAWTLAPKLLKPLKNTNFGEYPHNTPATCQFLIKNREKDTLPPYFI